MMEVVITLLALDCPGGGPEAVHLTSSSGIREERQNVQWGAKSGSHAGRSACNVGFQTADTRA